MMQLLFPSLLRAATRFSGTAFGLRPALAKSRRNGKPTRRRSEGHGEPVRKYLISQFGSFLSYTEGRFCPAMLIFGQAGVELDWVGLAWVVLDWDGLGLGLNWTGDGLEPGWTGPGMGWGWVGLDRGGGWDRVELDCDWARIDGAEGGCGTKGRGWPRV